MCPVQTPFMSKIVLNIHYKIVKEVLAFKAFIFIFVTCIHG